MWDGWSKMCFHCLLSSIYSISPLLLIFYFLCYSIVHALTVTVITDDLLNRVLLNFLKSLKQDKFHELKKCSTI